MGDGVGVVIFDGAEARGWDGVHYLLGGSWDCWVLIEIREGGK